ncbi:hypothetical protein [Prescottella agglutinans]|uniref:Uncharacterized protein n=1 Tax=Prescottella agglutinans TaxID=1644129 RepID=A0ABT6MF24_9NOCA|nr:hypothetical protein [Prescottella agglutinans]MDH6282917.1 hypothetical protein [Prescottella agglutinans]
MPEREFVDPPFIQFLQARLAEAFGDPAAARGIQSAINDYLEMYHFVNCDPVEWPDNHQRLTSKRELLQTVASGWHEHPDFRLMVSFNGDQKAMEKADAERAAWEARPYDQLQDWERELFTREQWETTAYAAGEK